MPNYWAEMIKSFKEQICDQMSSDMELGSILAPDRYYRLQYEKFVDSPVESLKKVFDFMGVEMTAEVTETLFNLTHTEVKDTSKLWMDGYFDVRKGASYRYDGWRNKLSAKVGFIYKSSTCSNYCSSFSLLYISSPLKIVGAYRVSKAGRKLGNCYMHKYSVPPLKWHSFKPPSRLIGHFSQSTNHMEYTEVFGSRRSVGTAIASVIPGNPLHWAFLKQNLNLGMVKMSVIPKNPLFLNPVLLKTSVLLLKLQG